MSTLRDGGSTGVSDRGPQVLVVGSGWRFTSGISYYTCRLANALGAVTPTRALLMRRLVPRVVYPGRRRVGEHVHDLRYDRGVAVYDGIDWYWGRSMRGAADFIAHSPPDVVVLQWWTGAVLHSYIRLAALAKRHGARVVMEWHEVQDTGEMRVPGAVRYVRQAMRRLLRHVDAHVVHSSHDLDLLTRAYGLDETTTAVIAHGPYDHVRLATGHCDVVDTNPDNDASADHRFNLLYFGVIRPYKGVEDLVAAFSRLDAGMHARLRLTIVGETWEGWTAPLDAVAASPARDHITVVNRYVTDAEVAQHFAAADAVVLPYHRSSSSGPLHIAMSAGLPVVVTAVGGLREAAADYEGATFVPPGDPDALAQALVDLPGQRGRRYTDPHSWDASVHGFREVFAGIGVPTWRELTSA